jgi:hypothetical protein
MTWDKLRDLEEVKQQGRRAWRERDAHELAMKQAQSQIDMVQSRVDAVDRVVAELIQSKPGTFASREEIAAWQAKLDELQAARAGFNEQRRNLNSIVASERMQVIKLSHLIDHLQRSVVNLQNAVEGRSPSGGWEGGLFRI